MLFCSVNGEAVAMIKITVMRTQLTVRSSRYMVFDKKSMPIVAYKTIIA